jgi:phage tail-like protein
MKMGKSSGRESDPLLSFNFGLELQGALAGLFTEIGGVGSENEIIEHKVVDEKGHEFVQKIPGRLKFTDITLKRGVTDKMDVWDWRRNVEEGKMKDARKNGSIVMYDRDYKALARWNFTNGWPSKVSGPNFKADSNEFAIEEMTIVHEGIIREK